MVATNAPSPGSVTPGRSEPDLEYGFDDPDILTEKEKRGLSQQGRNRDPSPQEIRAACEEIQAGWSPAERRSRIGAMPLSEATRKHVKRQLNRHGYVRGWTPPICRTLAGMGVTL